MSEETGLRWHALVVQSRHEKSVRARLEAKSEEFVRPLHRKEHKWVDRGKIASLPLSAGYIFRRSSALATTGVIDVVPMESQPAAIDACAIDAIQRGVKATLRVEPLADRVEGEPVRMSDGPFKGLTGTLKIREGLRLVVSVELLHRSVLMEVDRDWVVSRGFPKLACSTARACLVAEPLEQRVL